LSGRGLCDELITRPEESYRLCCVIVCDLETSRMGAPYIYDISHLRVNLHVLYKKIYQYLQQFFILVFNPFSYFLHLVFPSTKKRLSKFLNFVILLQLIIVYMQVPHYS